MARKKKPVARMREKGDSNSPSASLGRDLQSKIGNQLRAMHDDIVSEGVPARFQELLARLDRKDDKD